MISIVKNKIHFYGLRFATLNSQLSTINYQLSTKKMPSITIWNEFVHERSNSDYGSMCRQHYPNGIHRHLAEKLAPALPEARIRTASLDEPANGLPDDVLNSTDVLVWWGHAAHDKVPDDLVDRIHTRILAGMGLVALHSAHMSKIFRRVCGTSCMLRWRDGGRERVWVVDPMHPIVKGVPETFAIDETEMYGEPFGLPPDAHPVFMSWYEGGNVFRSGVTLNRGAGKVFYFSPGHETFPIYHDANVLKVIANGLRWVSPETPVGANPLPYAVDEQTPYEK